MFASTRTGALGLCIIQPQSLSGLLRRSRSARDDHARRSHLHSGGNLQLHRQAGRRAASTPTRRLVRSPDGHTDKDVNVAANTVGSSFFTIQARHIGRFKLTLTAHMGNRQDTVVREIEVVPDGQPREIVFNGRLDGNSESATHSNRHFPRQCFAGIHQLICPALPRPSEPDRRKHGRILRMPYGCFEQTSSSTYPNVLALDYMKRNRKITPEIRAKAEGFISTGYQRLLSFEVPEADFPGSAEHPRTRF